MLPFGDFDATLEFTIARAPVPLSHRTAHRAVLQGASQ